MIILHKLGALLCRKRDGVSSKWFLVQWMQIWWVKSHNTMIENIEHAGFHEFIYSNCVWEGRQR
jgi:hypothetical protein